MVYFNHVYSHKHVQNLVFALYFLKMVGVQELLRIRVVQFFKRMMRTDPGWKLTTVQHFVAEGVTKSTIYCSIQSYWHHKAPKRCWKAEEDHDQFGPCQAQKDCKPPHWVVSARSCFSFFLQSSLHLQGPQAA